MYNNRFPHPGMPASGVRYQSTMMSGMRYPPVYPNDPRYALLLANRHKHQQPAFSRSLLFLVCSAVDLLVSWVKFIGR